MMGFMHGNNFSLRGAGIMAFLVCTSVAASALSFARMFPDSDQYLQYSSFILGESTSVNYVVAMRPMLPLIASLISLTGLGMSQAYGIANTAFVILGALIAYELGISIFKSEEVGVLAAVLFATSPTILWFGAAVLVDSPGYFFTGLAVALSYRYSVNIKRKFAEEFSAVLGVIFKESVAFAIAFLLMARIYQKKWRTVLLAGAIVLVMELALLSALSLDPLVFLQKFYVAQKAADVTGSNWSIRNFAQTLVNAFVPYFPRLLRYTVYPLLVVVGFLKASLRDKRWLVVCFAVLSINAMIWPIMTQRYSFTTWPVVLPLLACGIVDGSKKLCNYIHTPAVFRITVIYTFVFLGTMLTNAQIYLTCAHAC